MPPRLTSIRSALNVHFGFGSAHEVTLPSCTTSWSLPFISTSFPVKVNGSAFVRVMFFPLNLIPVVATTFSNFPTNVRMLNSARVASMLIAEAAIKSDMPGRGHVAGSGVIDHVVSVEGEMPKSIWTSSRR